MRNKIIKLTSYKLAEALKLTAKIYSVGPEAEIKIKNLKQVIQREDDVL